MNYTLDIIAALAITVVILVICLRHTFVALWYRYRFAQLLFELEAGICDSSRLHQSLSKLQLSKRQMANEPLFLAYAKVRVTAAHTNVMPIESEQESNRMLQALASKGWHYTARCPADRPLHLRL